jgi:sulfur-carrier protein
MFRMHSVTFVILMPNQLTVLFFGPLVEKTGHSTFEISDVSSTRAALQYLYAKFPVLESMPFRIALDKELISEDCMIEGHQTMALLPPYAGG